jgi:hypothetical protein
MQSKVVFFWNKLNSIQLQKNGRIDNFMFKNMTTVSKLVNW